MITNTLDMQNIDTLKRQLENCDMGLGEAREYLDDKFIYTEQEHASLYDTVDMIIKGLTKVMLDDDCFNISIAGDDFDKTTFINLVRTDLESNPQLVVILDNKIITYDSYPEYINLLVDIVKPYKPVDTDTVIEAFMMYKVESPDEFMKDAEVDFTEAFDDEVLICDQCSDYIEDEGYTTIYGKNLCEDCWNEYINTPEALAEYVKGIAEGEYDTSDYDSDTLNQMAQSWKDNKDYFNLTSSEINDIETRAKANGFVF